jgi:hypothetical protein
MLQAPSILLIWPEIVKYIRSQCAINHARPSSPMPSGLAVTPPPSCVAPAHRPNLPGPLSDLVHGSQEICTPRDSVNLLIWPSGVKSAPSEGIGTIGLPISQRRRRRRRRRDGGSSSAVPQA